jgi:hypothetical protein
MKKKVFSLMCVAVIGTAAWNVSKSNNEVSLSDVALQNVEALASGESSCCIGSKFQITSIPGGWHCENDKGNSCCPVCF